MTRNISYKPRSFLSKYIDRFYIYEKSHHDYFKLPTVFPGTGLELLFHLEKPLYVQGKMLPTAHTVCPRKMFDFDNVKKVSFISVRFKSGAFRHFTTIPFSILNNQYLSIQDLWGEKGTHLLNILNKIPENEDKIQQIELFLIEMYHLYHNSENDTWDSIIDELYYNFNSYTIEELAKKTNMSLRQFERNFKTQFGLTAKEFQKIARFQDVIKKILLRRNPNYLYTILDNGYFDQSHFIREFKNLTEKTPLQYFTQENFESHFYHNSFTHK